MKVRYFYKIAAMILVFLGFYFVGSKIARNRFGEVSLRRFCEQASLVSSLELNGVLLDVYRDKNSHSDETLLIATQGDTMKTTMMLLEQSGTFERLLIGDSVYKKSGTLDFYVKRGDSTTLYILYYGCISE